MVEEEKDRGKSDEAPGQQRTHAVYDADGNPVSSPSGNEEWTQAEWRGRDKTQGYTRSGASDDDEDEG